MKEREDIKRNHEIQLLEEGKAELQKIANKIDEDEEKEKAKVIDCVNLLYNTYIIIITLCFRFKQRRRF